jgi:hypothetical protein
MGWTQHNDQTVNFANSRAQDAATNVDIPAESITPPNRHAIYVYNPGAVAITVKINAMEVIGANTRPMLLATLSVPAGAGRGVTVDGLLQSGGGARLIFSNDAAVGGAGVFDAELRLRSLRS